MKFRLAALTALISLCLAASAFAGELKINGSTTVFPIMQKAV
jgi:ABC-type phosphate transport system substrate-binding protein